MDRPLLDDTLDLGLASSDVLGDPDVRFQKIRWFAYVDFWSWNAQQCMARWQDTNVLDDIVSIKLLFLGVAFELFFVLLAFMDNDRRHFR